MYRVTSGDPVCATLDAPSGDAPDWRWDLDLTDPRQAYAAGCIDGYLYRRAEEDAERDQAWREAVRTAIRVIETTDRRQAADRGELPEGQRAA